MCMGRGILIVTLQVYLALTAILCNNSIYTSPMLIMLWNTSYKVVKTPSIKNTSVNRNKIKDGSLFNVWGRDVEPKKIRDDNSIDVTSDMFIIQDETLNAHDYILPDPTILKEFNEK